MCGRNRFCQQKPNSGLSNGLEVVCTKTKVRARVRCVAVTPSWEDSSAYIIVTVISLHFLRITIGPLVLYTVVHEKVLLFYSGCIYRQDRWWNGVIKVIRTTSCRVHRSARWHGGGHHHCWHGKNLHQGEWRLWGRAAVDGFLLCCRLHLPESVC